MVADLTEATRQRRTFDTAAILSVNGKMALVSPNLEVLCDFLQDRLIAAFCW